MPATELPASNTSERVLDVAERLLQSRGFNGFSYATIAGEMGISKASLHYHYRSKAELGEALIARYRDRFGAALAAIDETVPSAPRRLEAYADLYEAVVRGDRMCLCGMLAAEYETLPEPMRLAVIGFFDENEAWLARVLSEGRSDGTLSLKGSATDAARALLGSLEGAMLLARPYGDVARFRSAAASTLAALAA